MNCSQIKRRLSEPEGLDSADVQTHIRTCADCRRAWEAEHLLRDGLVAARETAGTELVMGTAPAWVDTIVTQERTHPMKSLVRNSFVSARRRWGFSLAVATAVVAFLVLVPFSYQHTVGTRLAITSSDPAMAQLDLAAINARLADHGPADATAAWSDRADGRALTYYVRGSADDARRAFESTRDLIPAAAATGEITLEPWSVRESGSLLAQIGVKVFEVSVSSVEGKTDAEIEEEIRSQLAAQGMQLTGLSYTHDADGQTRIKLEGIAAMPGGEAEVKIEDVRAGQAPGGDVLTRIVVAAPDSSLSDEEKIAEVKRQLAEQGITDAEVTIHDGKVEVKATKTEIH